MLSKGSLHFTARVAAIGVILVILCCQLMGCQRPVREDRTITFGTDGTASFQHGNNGVFITDATGRPKRIYEPGPNDLATSPPLWDPSGKRLLFTVAKSVDGTRAATGDTPADGRRIAGGPVRYSCYLFDPVAKGEPEKLFEAPCGHPGYVAAGLAVCWHPDGQGLDFVSQSHAKQHQAFAFDLPSRQAKPLDLPAAEHIALGSSSDRLHRCAVLGGSEGPCGLWVKDSRSGSWRLVPDSSSEKASLEKLRKRLPRWSRDGTKLAFVSGDALRVCDTVTRQTETWLPTTPKGTTTITGSEFNPFVLLLRSPDFLASLHWHPDGTHLGLVCDSSLVLMDHTGAYRKMTDAHVVAFAGWDVSGTRMAYVATERLPYSGDRQFLIPPNGGVGPPEPVHLKLPSLWTPLLAANPNSRSAIWFADADGANAKMAVSGLRATFPHWSPTESRLSVWLTVEPTYRFATDGRSGMRPGDPAAIIDPATGKLDWLPVNGTEHAQIGHAELRTGHLDEATRRFDLAAASLAPDAKADWMFFRAVALRKAGRRADAEEAWKRIAIPDNTVAAARVRVAAAFDPRLTVREGVIQPRHRFVAEGFISLEMVPEGIDFFRGEFKNATSDEERYSAAIVLGQLLLMSDLRKEFAEFAIDELLPLARRVVPNAKQHQEAISNLLATTLVPLAVSEFSASLPESLARRVKDQVAAWPSGTDDTDFVCQLILRACGQRLKDPISKEVETRIANHAARFRWGVPDGKEVEPFMLLLEPMAQAQGESLLSEYLRDLFGD